MSEDKSEHEMHDVELGRLLLRTVELSGGPETWAEDMCRAHGHRHEHSARLFALAWTISCCDNHRVLLGCAFLDELKSRPAVLAPDTEATMRLHAAMRAAQVPA